MPHWSLYVRSWGQSGKHMLAMSFSGFDPLRTLGHSQATGQIDRRRRFGTPGVPEAGPHLESGLLGSPEHRYHPSQLGHHQGESRTMDLNPDDTVYPVAKIALVLDALAAEGVPKEDALRCVRLSEASISSPAMRVSLNQVIDCCSYAAERSHDPHFAYHTGLRFHVSAYGMYGFAILSSINYRQAMKFAVKYHQLATPLVTMEFKENDGCGIWLLNPLSYARIDARLYKFIVEMQFGIILSLHRDFMGSSFFVREFQVTYPPSSDASKYAALFGAPVLFGQSANRLLFDSGWLDGTPRLGNEITYSTVVSLCDAQIEEFQFRRGRRGSANPHEGYHAAE